MATPRFEILSPAKITMTDLAAIAEKLTGGLTALENSAFKGKHDAKFNADGVAAVFAHLLKDKKYTLGLLNVENVLGDIGKTLLTDNKGTIEAYNNVKARKAIFDKQIEEIIDAYNKRISSLETKIEKIDAKKEIHSRDRRKRENYQAEIEKIKKEREEDATVKEIKAGNDYKTIEIMYEKAKKKFKVCEATISAICSNLSALVTYDVVFQSSPEKLMLAIHRWYYIMLKCKKANDLAAFSYISQGLAGLALKRFIALLPEKMQTKLEESGLQSIGLQSNNNLEVVTSEKLMKEYMEQNVAMVPNFAVLFHLYETYHETSPDDRSKKNLLSKHSSTKIIMQPLCLDYGLKIEEIIDELSKDKNEEIRSTYCYDKAEKIYLQIKLDELRYKFDKYKFDMSDERIITLLSDDEVTVQMKIDAIAKLQNDNQFKMTRHIKDVLKDIRAVLDSMRRVEKMLEENESVKFKLIPAKEVVAIAAAKTSPTQSTAVAHTSKHRHAPKQKSHDDFHLDKETKVTNKKRLSYGDKRSVSNAAMARPDLHSKVGEQTSAKLEVPRHHAVAGDTNHLQVKRQDKEHEVRKKSKHHSSKLQPARSKSVKQLPEAAGQSKHTSKHKGKDQVAIGRVSPVPVLNLFGFASAGAAIAIQSAKTDRDSGTKSYLDSGTDRRERASSDAGVAQSYVNAPVDLTGSPMPSYTERTENIVSPSDVTNVTKPRSATTTALTTTATLHATFASDQPSTSTPSSARDMSEKTSAQGVGSMTSRDNSDQTRERKLQRERSSTVPDIQDFLRHRDEFDSILRKFEERSKVDVKLGPKIEPDLEKRKKVIDTLKQYKSNTPRPGGQ